MAKAKKTESAETPKAEKPKAAAKKAPTKSTAAPAGTPLIDTNLAAQNAARLLAGGFNKTSAAGGGAESAMFKQMKAGLNKPASLNPLLDTSVNTGLNKATSGFKPNQQSANYSANVARTGVPRRNPG